MTTTVIDRIDRAILAALIADGRLSFRDLAAAVSLGPTATADRVRRLVAQGVVTGFSAAVDPAALGRPLEVACDVRLRPDVTGEAFEAALPGIPAVTDAVHLTGAADYLLRLACADPADLDATVRALKAAGARSTESRLVLRRVAGIDPAALVTRPGRPGTRHPGV